MTRRTRHPESRARGSLTRRIERWATRLTLWSLVAFALWTQRPRALDIVAHALPHVATLLSLIALTLIAFGPRRRAPGFALPALALWAAVLWSYRDTPLPWRDPAGTPVRVVVYNGLHVKSLHDNDFLRWFVEQDADFLVLIEPMRYTTRDWDQALALFPYRVQADPGHELSFHIFSRTPLAPDPMRIEGDDKVRPHLLTHAVQRASRTTLRDGREIRITGLHLRSPRTQRDFDIALRDTHTIARRARALYERDGVPTILAGDINSTPMGRVHRTLRRESGMRGWSRTFGAGTWPAQLSPIISLPIDRVFTTRELVCTRVRVGPAFNSDHRPIVYDLVLVPGEVRVP